MAAPPEPPPTAPGPPAAAGAQAPAGEPAPHPPIDPALPGVNEPGGGAAAEAPPDDEEAAADAPEPRRGPPWPDYTPPRREPPVIPPRDPTSRHRGFLKPEHRLTLFLLAGAAGTLLITLLFPPEPTVDGSVAGPAPVASTSPLEWPRERGATVALPAPETPPSVAPAADLEGAMARVVPAIHACAATHAAALAPLDGAVRLRLTVGAGGLATAELLDVAEVAAAPAACLAAAAWGAGWPTELAHQAVTLPFYVVAPLGSAPDGSAAPSAGPVSPTPP